MLRDCVHELANSLINFFFFCVWIQSLTCKGPSGYVGASPGNISNIKRDTHSFCATHLDMCNLLCIF